MKEGKGLPKKIKNYYIAFVLISLNGLFLASCIPTVRIEAPKKPIVINLNIKVRQDVQVRTSSDVKQLLKEKSAGVMEPTSKTTTTKTITPPQPASSNSKNQSALN